MQVEIIQLFKALEEGKLADFDIFYLLIRLSYELNHGGAPNYAPKCISQYLNVDHCPEELEAAFEFYKN